MNIKVELVFEVIDSQGLDRLTAYNMAGTDQLYYKEASSGVELKKAVEMCEASIDGPYRLEVWKGVRGQGRRAAGHPEYKFILAGRGGHVQAAAPDPRLDRLIAILEKQQEEEPEQANPVNDQLLGLAIQGLQKWLGASVAAPALPAPAVSAPVTGMDQAEAQRLVEMVAKYRQDNPGQYALMLAQLSAQYGKPNGTA